MKYNTVLFDADGTLFDFDKCERQALIKVLTGFDISISEQMILDYSKINDGFWKMLELGQIDKKSLKVRRFDVFCKKYGICIDPVRVADSYVLALAEQSEFIDGACDICKKLSENCRLYIITNGIKYVQEKRINNSALKPYFLDVFISEEIGCEKPNKAYFEAVSSKIYDFDRKSTLVVGDSLSSDIKGGLNFGLDVCWFNPKKVPKPFDMKINYTIDSLFELSNIIY